MLAPLPTELEPRLAPPDPTSARLQRWVARNPAPVGFSAWVLVFLGLVGLSVAFHHPFFIYLFNCRTALMPVLLNRRQQRVNWHVSQGHRFLCPGCLRFSTVQFACSLCKEAVSPGDMPNTGYRRAWWGPITEASPLAVDAAHLRRCHASRVFTAPDLLARCPRCRETWDVEPFHFRRVRVLATVTAIDADRLRYGRPTPLVAEDACAALDDGVTLTYFLNLATEYNEEAYGRSSHAAQVLEGVWLSGEGSLLDLGAGLDRTDRLVRGGWRPRVAFVECPPETQLAALLETRFRRVEWNVSPGDLAPDPILTGCQPLAPGTQ